MANIKSQIKRNRQNAARYERNRAVRSRLKTLQRNFRRQLEAGDDGQAREAYRTVARELDKAASKGVIHRNKAANRKSSMARQLESR